MSICFLWAFFVTSHKKSVFSFTSFKLKKLECAKGNKNDRIQKKILKQFLQNLMPINIKLNFFLCIISKFYCNTCNSLVKRN